MAARRKITTLEQENFDKDFGFHDPLSERSTLQTIQDAGKQVLQKWSFKELLLSSFPILGWLRGYRWKRWFVDDVISGCTVGIMNIPQGMAYGMLAGLPAVFGLYTSLFPPLFYAFLGTSRHMSFGTFAVISLLVSSAVQKQLDASHGTTPHPTALPDNNISLTTLSKTSPCDSSSGPCPTTNHLLTTGIGGSLLGEIAPDDPLRLEITFEFTLLVGLVMIALGLLHVGFVASYLSDQLVQGMTTGAAVFVFLSQVPSLLGLHGIRSDSSTPLGAYRTIAQIVTNIAQSNYVVCILSGCCLAVLILFKELLDPILRKRVCSIPFPIELFIVIGATVPSHVIGLDSNYNVSIVGNVPLGLRSPTIPHATYLFSMLPDAIITAVVIFSLAMSVSKTFATKFNYRLDSNQEWFAMGISMALSSTMGCHCAGGSLSRSLIQAKDGKTQLAAIVACFLVLLVLLVLASLFESLPKAALAAIIAVALKGMFMQFKNLPTLWKQSKIDFLIWIVSFVAVVLLGVSYGMIAGVAFAIVTVIYRSQWPEARLLGRAGDTNYYRVCVYYAECQEVPSIKIFRFDAPLYFANVDLFRDKLNECTGLNPIEEKERIRKAKKRYEKAVRRREKQLTSVEIGAEGADQPNGQAKMMVPERWTTRLINRMKRVDTAKKELKLETPVDSSPDIASMAVDLEDPSLSIEVPNKIHHVVIDCSSFPYIDSMGAKCLRDVCLDYKDIGVIIFLAHVKVAVRQFFVRCNFYESVPKSCLFVTVDDAVNAAIRHPHSLIPHTLVPDSNEFDPNEGISFSLGAISGPRRKNSSMQQFRPPVFSLQQIHPQQPPDVSNYF